MTWFRIDDTWGTHPKIQAAGLKARMLWIYGGLHCAQHLTDGRIDKGFLPVLAATAGVPAKEARTLVTVGLWADNGDHYQMNDFLDYQPSRAQVMKERERWARSKRKARQVESREVSTVDSRGESTPSRPDPTRPDHLLTVVPTTTIGSGGAAAVVEESIQAIAAYEALIAQGSGIEPDKGWPAYTRGIVKRLRTEDATERLLAAHEAHPEWTAEQLRNWYLEPEALTSYDALVPGLGGTA